MAQYWLEITSDYDPSVWTALLGSAGSPGRELSVVDDSGTPALRWGTTGTGRVTYLPDFVEDSEDVEIFIRTRASGAGTNFALGVGARLSRTQIDGFFAGFRIGGRLISAQRIDDSLTTLDTSGFGTGVSDYTAYHWMGVSAQGSSLEFSSWDGEASDRIATPLFSTTSTNLSGARPVGLINSNPSYYGYLTHIAVGTDGDPAPTGPVDVSAEPFLLRHNPCTNKVIPVLSSPTVTDIGANCVRPRVTKGF